MPPASRCASASRRPHVISARVLSAAHVYRAASMRTFLGSAGGLAAIAQHAPDLALEPALDRVIVHGWCLALGPAGPLAACDPEAAHAGALMQALFDLDQGRFPRREAFEERPDIAALQARPLRDLAPRRAGLAAMRLDHLEHDRGHLGRDRTLRATLHATSRVPSSWVKSSARAWAYQRASSLVGSATRSMAEAR